MTDIEESKTVSQYEFLSEDWLSSLERAAQRLLDASDADGTMPFTYVEKFTDAPVARLDGMKPGYVLKLQGGKATIGQGVRKEQEEEADCVVRMDYAAALASLKYPVGPELTELSGKAAADGRMQMSGSLAEAPIPMHELHDAAVGFTRI
jgi:hypothetical protein